MQVDVTKKLINQKGTFKTRDWSFLITEFVKDFYTKWEEITPINADGEMEWKTKGYVQNNVWDLTFDDMP